MYEDYFDDKEDMERFCNGILKEGEYGTYLTIRIASDYLGLPILVHRDEVKKNRFVEPEDAFLVRG